MLLVYTLEQVRRPVLEGIVAVPLIFTFFFLAMTGMLAFSNAILAYGGLFRRQESAYLLASPVRPRDIVIMKYLESLALSSWSLILLGLPLMMAIARSFKEPLSFYPVFIGLFLVFIPLPGALGLLLAWMAALVFPKTPRRMIVTMSALIGVAGAWWMWDLARTPMTSARWLTDFYDRVSLVQGSLLPHTWVSKGITSALQGQMSQALFYLFVTAANALFASFVVVGIVSRGYTKAFDRAAGSGARSSRRSGRVTTWLAEVLFAYMPWRQRLLAAKDLKGLCRDPMQWSQMAILVGLFVLYVANVQHILERHGRSAAPVADRLFEPDGRQPHPGHVREPFRIPAGFAGGPAVLALGFAAHFADADYSGQVSLCADHYRAGRCGGDGYLGVQARIVPPAGGGAYHFQHGRVHRAVRREHRRGGAMPVFNERNPARIAGGFGGTVSLFLSIALVVVSLLGMGVMSVRAYREDFGGSVTSSMVAWLVAVVTVNVVAAGVAMGVGMRHFSRMEC